MDKPLNQDQLLKQNQPLKPNQGAGVALASEPTILCVMCGLEVEKRLAKDGEYCFECAVHSTCACEDPRR